MVSINSNLKLQQASLLSKNEVNEEAICKKGITIKKPAFPEQKLLHFDNEQQVADAINAYKIDVGGAIQVGNCEYVVVGWATDKDGKAIPPIQLSAPGTNVGGYGRLK